MLVSSVAAISTSLCGMAADQSTLTFSGGAGDGSVDGFPGSPDAMWSSGWITTADRGIVEAEIEHEGEDRGLKVLYKCTEIARGGQSSRAMVRRSLDPSLTTAPHVIETTVVFSDAIMEWQPVGDFWGFGASSSPFSRVNPTQQISWLVMASVNGWKAWAMVDDEIKWVDLSDQTPVPGVNYKIRVEVDPDNHLWSVELSSDYEDRSLRDLAMATTGESLEPALHNILTYYCSLDEPGDRAVFMIKSLGYSAQPSEH